MSASVRISEKAARWLLCAEQELTWAGGDARVAQRVFDEVRSGLDSLKRKSAKRKPRREEKKAKKEKKNSETARIRKEVFRRASGYCEACGVIFSDFDPGEMDHFWGRAKAPQTVRNCWALCLLCHRLKHAEDPSPECWLGTFLKHVERCHYFGEQSKAQSELEAMAARRAADLVTTAKHETIDLGPIKAAALSGKEGR